MTAGPYLLGIDSGEQTEACPRCIVALEHPRRDARRVARWLVRGGEPSNEGLEVPSADNAALERAQD